MTDNLDQLREAVDAFFNIYAGGDDTHYLVWEAAQKYLKLMEGIEGLYRETPPQTIEDSIENQGTNQALDNVKKLMEE